MKNILGVFVLAGMLAVPVMASAADKLPEGFIAVSDTPMNWNDAVVWCKQQGRKLPRINNSDLLGTLSGEAKDGAKIDGFGTGFGAKGAPWPSGLPNTRYWTGTRSDDSSAPSFAWIVGPYDGKVYVYLDHQSNVHRVVCVP